MKKPRCKKCKTLDADKFYPSNPYKCKPCLKGADIRRPNGGTPELFIIPQSTLDQYSGMGGSMIQELREKYV